MKSYTSQKLKQQFKPKQMFKPNVKLNLVKGKHVRSRRVLGIDTEKQL